MVRTRNESRGKTDKNEMERGGENGNRAEYEESRAQRMKENMERMKSLGILDLSKQLNKPRSSKPSSRLPPKAKTALSNDPPRRSSRLKDMPTVSYTEKRTPKKESSVRNVEIHIPEGKNPEIYTEEHEKLLGDCKAAWELFVDGFGEDGERMYDPIEGKSCHQCRQKTLGRHTKCSKCDLVTGQFCGDCLYMSWSLKVLHKVSFVMVTELMWLKRSAKFRYGENVIEVNENLEWVCPACRGICNCSRCRRNKGWEPTGSIYRKVVKLGYKSVAHYLIYTCRGQTTIEASAAESPISIVDESISIDVDKKEGTSHALTQRSAKNDKRAVKVDSHEEYRGDDDDEDSQ